MRFENENKINFYLYEVLGRIEENDKLLKIFNEELLDGELYYHSVAVAKITIQLLISLNFKDANIIDTGVGAILHDAGKLYVPKEILYKPGKLVDDEFSIIKKHPIQGYEVLKDTGISEDSLNVIRWHHEKLDGSGYPDGLTDIPMNVQLVTVADIFSAMTERRCYHQPMTTAKTLRYLDSLNILSQEGVDALFDSIID